MLCADRRMKDYMFEYWHNGSRWTFTVPATSFEDAEDRLVQIRNRARLCGEIEMTVPAQFGIFVRVWCWVKNLFGGEG